MLQTWREEGGERKQLQAVCRYVARELPRARRRRSTALASGPLPQVNRRSEEPTFVRRFEPGPRLRLPG